MLRCHDMVVVDKQHADCGKATMEKRLCLTPQESKLRMWWLCSDDHLLWRGTKCYVLFNSWSDLRPLNGTPASCKLDTQHRDFSPASLLAALRERVLKANLPVDFDTTTPVFIDCEECARHVSEQRARFM